MSAPGAKEGDIIDVLDANNVGHKMKLSLPIGEEFAFIWEGKVEPEVEARFVKENNEWLIKVEGNQTTGDTVRVTSTRGVQENQLGESAGDGPFGPVKRNHFKRNPAGDIVNVSKADCSIQRHRLVSEVRYLDKQKGLNFVFLFESAHPKVLWCMTSFSWAPMPTGVFSGVHDMV